MCQKQASGCEPHVTGLGFQLFFSPGEQFSQTSLCKCPDFAARRFAMELYFQPINRWERQDKQAVGVLA